LFRTLPAYCPSIEAEHILGLHFGVILVCLEAGVGVILYNELIFTFKHKECIGDKWRREKDRKDTWS
jgi:hypothetical protein